MVRAGGVGGHGDSARVGVLDDRAGRRVAEIVRELPRRLGVVVVEVREREPAVLRDGIPPGGAAGAAVARRPLVRVLSVPQLVLGSFERYDEMAWQQLITLEPADDGGVVRGGVRKRLESEATAGLVGEGAVMRPELVEHVVVLLRARHHADPGVVLRRRADHGRSADVDGLDVRALEERVQVAHDELDGLDALGLEVGAVAVVPEIGEEAAVNARVQRLHAPVEHLGGAGDVLDGRHRDARIRQRGGRLPRRHRFEAEVDEPACELDEARLVVHREQGALHSLLPFLEQRTQHLRVEASLDFLDRHRLLGEDRAVIDFDRGGVDRAAGHLDAGRERVLDRVRALERREQGGMCVRDLVAVRVVDRMLEDRHETRHGDEVDLVALERVDDPLGVRPPVEVGPEALALDELDGDGGALGDVDRAARPVDDDDADREPGLDQRLEDRSASRRENPDPPHIGKLPEGRLPARDLAIVGTGW